MLLFSLQLSPTLAPLSEAFNSPPPDFLPCMHGTEWTDGRKEGIQSSWQTRKQRNQERKREKQEENREEWGWESAFWHAAAGFHRRSVMEKLPVYSGVLLHCLRGGTGTTEEKLASQMLHLGLLLKHLRASPRNAVCVLWCDLYNGQRGLRPLGYYLEILFWLKSIRPLFLSFEVCGWCCGTALY